MKDAFPLLAGSSDSCIAWHAGRAITRGEFLSQAMGLARRLPDRTFAINLCDNRYKFTVAFAAALLRQQTTLLPPNRTAAALGDVESRFADHHVIDDSFAIDPSTIDSSATKMDASLAPIAAERLAAIVFTSGSTGAPQENRKIWRTLVGVAEQEAERLFPNRAQVVATVPAQHMYGFETTVLLALATNCAIHDGKPLFPADVRVALQEISEPRVLVTTPWHLQACLRSGVQMPPVHAVISASAPLDVEVARAVESRWQTEVHEIYGCTEAGSMASRRTVHNDVWHAYRGGRFWEELGVYYYQGMHLPEPVPLQDRLEVLDDAHVRLVGRAADTVKIGGKRASLAELTGCLLSIEGVLDAVIFQPQVDQRLVALAVAPSTTSQALLEALARRFDPAFLPRPLLLVERLPRNELGKLPQAELLAAFERARSASIPA